MKSASYKEKLQTIPQTALPTETFSENIGETMFRVGSTNNSGTIETVSTSAEVMDNEVRTSVAIRREFNKTFKGNFIKHCRVTSGG